VAVRYIKESSVINGEIMVLSVSFAFITAVPAEEEAIVWTRDVSACAPLMIWN